MPQRPVEMPECPRGHGSLRIVFGGHYGHGKAKQMYKCTPADGSRPHRFVPALPRQPLPAESRCLECENPVHIHEGPKMGRVFRYPVRTVVRALGQVAEGKPYTAASDGVRHLTTRECGTLVSDWVEAFTPDLWSVLGPQQWPAFLVADARTFYVRDWSQRANPRRRPPKHERLPRKPAFTLAVVMGADPPPSPMEHWTWKPVVAHLFPGGGLSAYDWCYLFSLLPGRPLGVTSDESHAFFNAVAQWWPADPVTGEAPPAMNLCLFHAKTRFRDHVAPASVKRPYGPKTQKMHDTLWPLWDALAEGPDEWAAFLDYASSLTWSQPIRSWLRRSIAGVRKDHLLSQQIGRPWPSGPNSNSVAEAEIRRLTSLLGRGRVHSFRNAERTNRLLQLMVLARRGDYDERTWTEVIDRTFASRSHAPGRPEYPLRTFSDPSGSPSLR